jgi:hypothetical protein
MGVGLIVLLAVVAWALGPTILRFAGGLLTIAALMLWALPMGTHTSAVALIFTGASGTAMWHSGTTWQAHRDAARFSGHRTAPGRELITRPVVRLRRSTNTR